MVEDTKKKKNHSTSVYIIIHQRHSSTKAIMMRTTNKVREASFITKVIISDQGCVTWVGEIYLELNKPTLSLTIKVKIFLSFTKVLISSNMLETII